MSTATTRNTLRIEMTVNAESKVFEAAPGETLSALLRRAGYLGVKTGCYTGDCGTCVVLLDGEPVLACLMLAGQAQGAEVRTVEGMSRGAELHPIQAAYLDHGAVQCGFCTPAMLLTTQALLERNPSPSEAEAREALSATLCRCTGYERPVMAIMSASKRAKGDQ